MANLLIDLTLTSPHTVGGSFADIADMDQVVTIAGPSSVVILMMSLNPEIVNGDECAEYRFTHDGARVGPEVSSFVDTADEGSGRSIMFAMTGLSAGSHTFAVQAQNREGVAIIDVNYPRTFQCVEIESGASLLVDLSSSSADSAPATYANVANLSQSQTPAAGALLLFITGITQLDTVDDDCADYRFAIDGTRDGPELAQVNDDVDNVTSLAMAWAITGVSAAAHTFSVQWQQRNNVAEMDTARARIFQVVEITTGFDLLVDKSSIASDSAPDSYADMVDMTGSPNIDSVDSVALLLANYSQLDQTDKTVDNRFEIAGTQEGAEVSIFTDSAVSQRSDPLLMALAITGEVGVTAVSLQWQKRRGTSNADTARPRTFQVIDFTAAVANLAGSIPLTLTPAAAIQANGELAGSSALVISPAAALAATGELAGAVALLLTPAAAIQATGELTGTVAIVITPSGDLKAVGGNLAGVIPLVLTATGTLEAIAALAGAATITLTPSGTLQATGGLLGTSTLTLTLAGNLQAVGELLGTVPLVLTPSGILVAEGGISGSAALVFTPAATLAGIGGLSGTIPLTLAAAGQLLALGGLAGGLTMAITPAGVITANASISGSADLVFTLNGALPSIGDLAGSIDITIDPSGTLIALGELTGSTDLSLTAAGDLGGVGLISGSAQLTLSADGTLRAIGELSGLAALAFALTGNIFDQSARRIPNSLQSFLVFLQNTRQDLSAGELNSDQSITAGRINSEQ